MPRPKLSVVSTASLQAELQRRLATVGNLIAKRDALDKQIAELQVMAGQAPAVPQAATEVGKKLGRKPGRRPGRKPKAVRATGKPLAEYVKEVLAAAAQGMALKDIEAAVLAAGYPSKAKTLYTPIMKVLPRAGAKKLGRGVYGLRGKPGRKAAKKDAAPAAPAAKTPRKRKTYAQTADQFVLGLVQGKGATTAEINAAWRAARRVGRADNTLNKMSKAGKLKREKLAEGKGSTYTVA
jgi:hypothetical protein